jgi:membrane-bound serine protease (ClpP class)
MKSALIRFGLVIAIIFGSTSTAASAATSSKTPPGRVRVIEVNGYLDPIMADFIVNSIRSSEKEGDEVLIIQFDSHGSLLSSDEQSKLITEIKNAKVPIAVWVGGVGARATNGAYPVIGAAGIVGVAPATGVGPTGNEMTAAQALNEHVAQIAAPVLQQFIFLLDGKTVNGHKLHTANSSGATKKQRVIQADISFAKPSLLARFLHATSSPSVAYMFLVIALLLLVFEFFSVGVGVAAAAGLLLLLPSAYGLGVLPTNGWAVALLVFSIFAFSIDIQAGAARAWTIIATVLFVIASLNMYSGLALPPLTFIPMLILTVLFVVLAMPSTIRARFSLPTIGREWMLGEMGTAQTSVDPDGTIDLRGGSWPARTNRATPIAAGDRVRVVDINGIVLEVEPESGGAKDAHH